MLSKYSMRYVRHIFAIYPRLDNPEHIVVIAGDKQMLFTPLANEQTLPGQLGLSLPQRKWISCDIGQELGVEIHKPHPTRSFISSMVSL